MAPPQSWTCDRCDRQNWHQAGIPCRIQKCTSTPGCNHPRCPPWIIALDQGLATIAAVDWRELPCHYGVSCTGKDTWCPHNHSMSAQFLVRLSSAETQAQAQRIADKLNDTLPQSLLHDTAVDLRKARVHDLEQEIAEVQQRLDCARQALTEAQVTEAKAKLDLDAAEAAVGASLFWRHHRAYSGWSRINWALYSHSAAAQGLFRAAFPMEMEPHLELKDYETQQYCIKFFMDEADYATGKKGDIAKGKGCKKGDVAKGRSRSPPTPPPAPQAPSMGPP